MPTFNTNDLLTTLDKDVHGFLQRTAQLSAMDTKLLLQQPAANKWSAIQVVEHLNSYNRYYLAHIEQAMQQQGARYAASKTFGPGWLGEYFTKSMYSDVQRKKEITNKMKAPKDHRPLAALDAKKVMEEFVAGEQKLLQLIATARSTNIAKVRVPISIARWIKISMGDTFRFLVAHQERHFLQISNTLAAVAQ